MGLSPQHEQLNRALDEQLTGAALADFQARLDANPSESELYEQLRQVDDLFRHPPMMAAPPDFASKVMLSIEQGKHEAYAPRRRLRTMLGFGLLGTLVSVPVLLVVLVAVVPAVVDPGVLADLLQGLIVVLGTITGVFERLFTFLGSVITTYPMAPALFLTVIPLVMVWAWLVWFLQRQNRPATVIVPVQTVGSTS